MSSAVIKTTGSTQKYGRQLMCDPTDDAVLNEADMEASDAATETDDEEFYEEMDTEWFENFIYDHDDYILCCW